MKPSPHRVAIHEAGHAIVACFLGLPVRLVSVKPTPGTLGFCDCARPVDPRLDAVLFFGGREAEFLHLGIDLPPHGPDLDAILEAAELAQPDHLSPSLARQRHLARDLLSLPFAFQATAMIAEELASQGTLEGHVIRDALSRALPPRWRV